MSDSRKLPHHPCSAVHHTGSYWKIALGTTCVPGGVDNIVRKCDGYDAFAIPVTAAGRSFLPSPGSEMHVGRITNELWSEPYVASCVIT
jgi:hypothetical protein